MSTSVLSGDPTWGNISVVAWSNKGAKLNYAIVLAQQEFEPLNPPVSYSHHYELSQGASVVINGLPIIAKAQARLLTVNPFGQLEELVLTEAEGSVILQKTALEAWTEVALPHVARLEGECREGRRVGHWSIYSRSGKKGYEGDYVDGLRHGEWIYYRQDGSVRARLQYRRGKLDGAMISYDETGHETRRSLWKDDFPLEGPETHTGLSSWVTRRPDRTSSGGTR